MSVYNIGTFIKYRRSELGLTQEELSEGICSVTTLSRIETGSHPPTRAHAQALLQRLGGTDFFPYVASEKEFEMLELQWETRLALARHDIKSAKELIQKLTDYSDIFSDIDRQLFEVMYTSINSDEFSDEEALKRYEDALKITHSSYRKDNLPGALSHEEAAALSNIAIRYDILGERETAIKIFYHLKKYYENYVTDIEEARRALPTIIYNLTKILGLCGRYDECIDVCDQGIAFCKKYSRCEKLAQILYNKAWSLNRRGKNSDAKEALQSAKEAYCLCKIIGNQPTLTERVKAMIVDNFGGDLPLI